MPGIYMYVYLFLLISVPGICVYWSQQRLMQMGCCSVYVRLWALWALRIYWIESVLSARDLPVLVGCGTDGASVNVSSQNGMRGKLQAALPWLYWVWCYGHRLELACKDAFSSHLFQDIDEMMLRLYYLYEKSPKKCRELSDLVTDLKEVFTQV